MHLYIANSSDVRLSEQRVEKWLNQPHVQRLDILPSLDVNQFFVKKALVEYELNQRHLTQDKGVLKAARQAERENAENRDKRLAALKAKLAEKRDKELAEYQRLKAKYG